MRECEICHRTSDEVQIAYCTPAGKYLCSKHKNQFYRHGMFMSDERKILVCDVCGATNKENRRNVTWCSKAQQYLCNKHRTQFVKLGYIKPQTKRDRNDYVLHDDYAEIIFRDQDQNVIDSAMIDLEDVEKCRPHKWMRTEMMGNSRYVKAIINGKNTGLHRFVLDYNGNMVVDHINRNGLDNRKSNLRIVTPSENSANSKTRSQTKEKNIYIKHNKYQVQIIRNYKNVYYESFDTLEEAVAARDSFLLEYNKQHNRVV